MLFGDGVVVDGKQFFRSISANTVELTSQRICREKCVLGAPLRTAASSGCSGGWRYGKQGGDRRMEERKRVQ